MIADKQTDTDRQTDMLIALRFHTGGAVINNAGDLFTVVPAGLYLFSLSIIISIPSPLTLSFQT